MTNHPIFRGAATALITPMTESGIDYEAFGRIIDWQIDEGINALVVTGTSGEAPTLTDEEHHAAIAYAVERVAGRVPVIAGTGSNDTAHAVAMSRFACEAGADALLVVTPYYNKATQKGLIQMYTTIADAVTKPLILYNVPSRTGVNIEPSTYAALAGHPNIAAIKEANGNISKIVETAALVGDRLDIYSGNDDQVIPLLSMGGAGVISVLSNILPARTAEMCERWFRGDAAGAAALQCELLPITNALFSQVNPIPVKAAMAAMGWCENYVRLPLTPMEDEPWRRLRALMAAQGLLD
ncbi:MAG: 4-hydroxy-tetrahydrodipicolinate synthase [Oscillospiraceae bacterium]|nr:4-hydroxy-tetrahydrodipicolinate synthase [Oscillospiraceae bacterium]